MQAFLNIEKRPNCRSTYIGYGRGTVWRIARCLCGDNKWRASDTNAMFDPIYGRTLGDISKQLEG